MREVAHERWKELLDKLIPDKLKGSACPKLEAGFYHLRDFRPCTFGVQMKGA